MQRLGDTLIVFVISAILWAVTAALILILTNNVMPTENATLVSLSLSTLIATGFFAFWIKGRSLSEKEGLDNKPKPISDIDVILSYGSLFAELDPSLYLYDESLLPYSKERILSAAVSVLKRPDTPEIIRVGAVFAKDLGNFQKGVGKTPLPTKSSTRFDSWRPDGTASYVEQFASSMARYEPSDIEIRANEERKRIDQIVEKALAKSQTR